MYLIEDPLLLQSFDKSCIRLWEQDWISAQLFILRRMVSLKGHSDLGGYASYVRDGFWGTMGLTLAIDRICI